MNGTVSLHPSRRAASLRRSLLLGLGGAMLLLSTLHAAVMYRAALLAADTAYDRTLLASAKTIGELLDIATEPDGRLRLTAELSYAALEPFEADNRSRIFYKVTGFDGAMVTGFEDLKTWSGPLPERNLYAALVHFYDDTFQGVPVRVGVLLQPVASVDGQGMATIQVAETLELREALALSLLEQTLWQQGLLMAAVILSVLLLVHRVTDPVQRLSNTLKQRAETELSPLSPELAPSELRPIVDATNDLMKRLSRLLNHQKRFVRDASHQLRTPLAVLQTQVQSALRGDVDPRRALEEIEQTVTSANTLASQMLALAKVEQLRHEGQDFINDWAPIVQQVALELAPLIADKQLDFELQLSEVSVRAHAWALRELTRNLLHNAIRYTPAGGPLLMRLQREGSQAVLLIRDGGPGLDNEIRERLFQPFVQGRRSLTGGTGLGLAICGEIVQSLGGTIVLNNRQDAVHPRGENARADAAPGPGLDATVQLPLSTAPQDLNARN
jgi:two-component system sensor histidine kinase TctE